MSIFRRNKDADPGEATEPTASGLDVGATVRTTRPARRTTTASPTAAVEVRGDGPWDVAEVDGRDGRVDLGALLGARGRGDGAAPRARPADPAGQRGDRRPRRLRPPAPGLRGPPLRAASGTRSAARSPRPSSRRAAPSRSTRGGLGTELRTRMPSAGPDGRTVFAPATFVGVDGPRWFLRGVLSGRGRHRRGRRRPAPRRAAGRGRRPRHRADGAARAAAAEPAHRARPPPTTPTARRRGRRARLARPVRARPRDHRGAVMGLRERLRDYTMTSAEHEAEVLAGAVPDRGRRRPHRPGAPPSPPASAGPCAP